jgi:hypothetical protein
MSNTDQKRGCDGSRTYHWAKDIIASARQDLLTDRHLVSIVDVDYYLDMPNVLLNFPNVPICLYTMIPSAAVGVDGDGSFTFNKEGEIILQISGGGRYQHKLWNYSPDTIGISDWWSLRTYAVEKRGISDHRAVVLLTPTAQWNGLWSILPRFLLAYTSLQRFNPISGNYVRLDCVSSGKVTTSVSPIGTSTQATVDAKVLDALQLKQKNSATAVGDHTVKKLANEVTDTETQVLVDFVRNSTSKTTVPYVMPICNSIMKYTVGRNTDDQATPSLQAFMPPIVAGTYAPERNLSNMIASIVYRVLQPQAQSKPQFSRRLVNYVKEFCEFFISKCIPVDKDEVARRLKRPSQRRIMIQGEEGGEAEASARQHNKREGYQRASPPRIITEYEATNKLEYSTFIYAAMDFIHEWQTMNNIYFYAFGDSMTAIASAVAQKLYHALFALLSDFTSYDGYQNEVTRYFERQLMMAMFDPEYHSQLINIMGKQVKLPVSMKWKDEFISYNMEYQRGSGSMETSFLNTMLNAFVHYYGLRISGLSPNESMRQLGIYGGDDGLTGLQTERQAECIVQVCEEMGLVMKVNLIERGAFGINFLARVYGPNVWTGDNNSCCDIKRQLSKFHTTHAVDIDPQVKLIEKARSFFYSDRNTPIIGDLARRVVELSGEFDCTDDPHGLRSYDSLVPAENQYPNVFDDWMMLLVEQQLPEFDVGLFLEHIRSASLVGILTNTPLCHPVLPMEAKVDSVVDDTLVLAGEKPDTSKEMQAVEAGVLPPPIQPQSAPPQRPSKETALVKQKQKRVRWGKRPSDNPPRSQTKPRAIKPPGNLKFHGESRPPRQLTDPGPPV